MYSIRIRGVSACLGRFTELTCSGITWLCGKAFEGRKTAIQSRRSTRPAWYIRSLGRYSLGVSGLHPYTDLCNRVFHQLIEDSKVLIEFSRLCTYETVTDL